MNDVCWPSLDDIQINPAISQMQKCLPSEILWVPDAGLLVETMFTYMCGETS